MTTNTANATSEPVVYNTYAEFLESTNAWQGEEIALDLKYYGSFEPLCIADVSKEGDIEEWKVDKPPEVVFDEMRFLRLSDGNPSKYLDWLKAQRQTMRNKPVTGTRIIATRNARSRPFWDLAGLEHQVESSFAATAGAVRRDGFRIRALAPSLRPTFLNLEYGQVVKIIKSSPDQANVGKFEQVDRE